jgi:hypothetical protein
MMAMGAMPMAQTAEQVSFLVENTAFRLAVVNTS